MAKIRLGRMIVSRVWGPGGNARWSTKRTREASLRAQPKRLTVPRHPTPETTPEQDEAAAQLHCECKAWKAADLAYQSFTRATKAAIRDANPWRKTSAYDAYMKWAMRHLIRGMPVGPTPVPGTLQHFAGNYNPTENELALFAPSEVLRPEQACSNFGLHYAKATFIEYPRDPPEADYAQGAVFLLTEAKTFNRPDSDTYFYRRGTYGAIGEPPTEPPEPWEQVWRYTTDDWFIEACPAHCLLWYAPPLRDNDGALIEPPEPDLDRTLKLTFSTTDLWYTHWPNRPGSHKGDHTYGADELADWIADLWPPGWKYY